MMKKNGFTLAEVLITLTIIGVVAMMTLPALMTNVQEQQAKTGLKKGFNTLTEAAQMNQAVDGFGYADIRVEGRDNSADGISREQSLRGLLLNRAQVDTRLTHMGMTGENSPTELTDYMNARNNPIMGLAFDRVVSFRDGSSLMYNSTNAQAPLGSVATDENNQLQADGLPLGFVAVYDMNGVKGPNQLSNCSHGMNVTTDNGTERAVFPDSADCNERANRVIKDQFFVRLRGTSVTPGSAAAKWVLDN